MATAIDSANILTLGADTVVIAADERNIPFGDSDATEGNEFVPTGKDLLAVYNNGTGAQTVSIDARADEFGRDGSITDYELAEDEVALFKLFSTELWMQTDGTVQITTSDDNVQLAVIRVE